MQQKPLKDIAETVCDVRKPGGLATSRHSPPIDVALREPAFGLLHKKTISPAAKTHFGGEPGFVRYNFFMIDSKRVRHAFSENAR